MTSTILSNLAETYPEVLKNPEKYLGPNYLKVLEFWEHIEGLSEQEKGGIAVRFWNLDYNVRLSDIDAAMTSAILSKLAEIYPEVLTNPEKYLGPNYLKVLEFWEHIEGLSKQEREEIADRYWALDFNVRVSANNAAWDAATEVVDREFSGAAWCVTGRFVFGWATEWFISGRATVELIGNVDNKVAYDLIMSHKNS